MKKGNLIVLTGSGISAESGLRTFRDSNGLWESHKIEDVATPQAWSKDMDLVLEFYNQRRTQLAEVSPNSAHLALAELEESWNVTVITQNVDDLHERAGSSDILHLHGELTKVRSAVNKDYIEDIGYRKLYRGELCPSGHQLRPHIVWFGEVVPMMDKAHKVANKADFMLVIGTSLNVYPAAGLIHSAPPGCEILLVDPDPLMKGFEGGRLKVINKKATSGMKLVAQYLLDY
ncbi:MAG: NAD-dependent deacylase [Flavobacteriales bacterium]|nr:NAD-dependent deacylase [Flavobacteriales bacterium]